MTKQQKGWTVNAVVFAALFFAGWRVGLIAIAGCLAILGLFKLCQWYDA